ncbi:MAG: nascent polypeptide-associated complex subunit alpha [Candidatus Woesearchaeota archaeon]|nr:nascent polypeptide-associated complex subunit alpha [Candidatus Woesearchaeota archaeon]
MNIPGNLNQRQLKQAMKRMGIQQEEIESERVIIELPDSRIVIENPSVLKVNMMGQSNYQISGEENIEEKDNSLEITSDDIKTVMESASCSEEEARKALQENDGDIAKSILSINSKSEK